MRPNYCLLFLLLLLSVKGFTQHSLLAKQLRDLAVADTLARKDSIAALHFADAASEELKLTKPDYEFATKMLYNAGKLNYLKIRNYQKAQDYYYKALETSHKSGSNLTFLKLRSLGMLYESSKETYQVFKFPVSGKQETLEAYFPIIAEPYINKDDGKNTIRFEGGSNDGVHEGATGIIYAKHIKGYKDRENTKLGTLTITKVFPNFSLASINLDKPKDSFYSVYLQDMVAVPIRFPQKFQKDPFLEVSLLNIRFVDNGREAIAHPRTLMYYGSPQMENDVYAYMKDQVIEIYDYLHTDSNPLYHAPILKGRFRGLSLMDAMKITKTADLKNFLGFVRSYPGKYMGGIWKISEVYATWIISDADPGSYEAMDSLLAYYNNEGAFKQYLLENKESIHKDLFNKWENDAQNLAYAKDFTTALQWNAVLQKVSLMLRDDSLLAWSYFNRGLIHSEENKDSLAIECYKKGRVLFAKAGNETGESFCINNIGQLLQKDYKFNESEKYFDASLLLRLAGLQKDTSDDVKEKVARGYWAVGSALQQQSKYKEAIEKYQLAIRYLKNIPAIKAKDELATMYSNVGKNFQNMGDYKEAAKYYDLESGIRKALNDEQAMANAFDNKGYLLSKMGESRMSLEAYNNAYTLHLSSANMDDAGFSMSNIAQMLWGLGKYDSAILSHNKSIELRAGNKKGQAYSWKQLGALYKENGQPQKSLDAYNKAVELYKDIDDKELSASLQDDFASNYSKVKDYANALKYYKEALNTYITIKSRSKIADDLYNIATVYYDDKQYEQAEKTLEDAIKLQKEINDHSGLLYSYEYKGLIQQYFYGDYTRALNYIKEALALAQQTTSPKSIAYTQAAIGSLYENTGVYDSAEYYFTIALNGYKKLDDSKNVGNTLIRKGFLYTELAQYNTSKKYFEDALEVAAASDNKSMKAEALSGLSQLEYLSGNFVKGIELNAKEMALWRQEDNPWGIASSYISLGNIKNRQSEFGEAISNYEKADSMYKTLRMEKNRATSINNIGDIYFNQNDFDKSLPKFLEALQILQRTNDDKRFISLVKANIGEVYMNQKKYTEAGKWLNESLSIARTIKNTKQIYQTGVVLGKLKTLTKDYEGARALFEEANDLIKKTGEKLSLIELETEWGKWFYLKKDFRNAELHSQNSIDLSKSIGLKTHVWKAYSTISDVKAEQKNLSLAVIALQQAILVVEDLKSRIAGGDQARKIFENEESVVDIYLKMAKYLKKLGRNDEALAYLEKSNIENLNVRFKNEDPQLGSTVEKSDAATGKAKKAEIFEFEKQRLEELSKPKEQQNKDKLARLEKMTTIAEENYQDFIVTLRNKYPSSNDLKKIDASQFIAERTSIPPDVALLSYLITKDELSIFVVMNDTLLIKDIPINQQLLEQKIRQFNHANAIPRRKDGNAKRGADEDLPKGDSVDIDGLGIELYNLLIGPARDAIAGRKYLAIVPSGLLCFVPFQALTTKNAQGKRVYFGEEKQIFYVNTITTVTNKRNEILNDLRIVAVGNADQSLANSEIEVKNLQQQFPTAVVYIGDAATKKNVLETQGQYNVLHLATHGILDYAKPENSYLVFASDKLTGDDGKLHINDISHIKNLRRFKLVTLSACETAVVEEIIEGWPISTASAFIRAGVPTVIASLWKVDDKATALLMEQFYANMKTMDKVAALQKAQMFLRQTKEYADPFYWAPFQLVGLWQ